MRKIVAYSRRTFLARSAAVTGVAGLSAVLAACGGSTSASDSESKSTEPETVDPTAQPVASLTEPAPTNSTEPVVVPATDPADPADPASSAPNAPVTEPASSANALDTAQELAVSFSFVVDESSGGGGGRGGGRIRNPYVAVWIEDADGNAVRTIDLSFQQDRKGKKWLNDLKRWYRQDQARVEAGGVEIVDTVSSATRTPGDYSVAWDMTSEAGDVQNKGDYYICVEAAREDGPYGIVRELFTLDGTAFSKPLEGDGELQNVVVELRAV